MSVAAWHSTGTAPAGSRRSSSVGSRWSTSWTRPVLATRSPRDWPMAPWRTGITSWPASTAMRWALSAAPARNLTSTCHERKRSGRSARPTVPGGSGGVLGKADLGGEDSPWRIVEDGFTPVLAGTYETVFEDSEGRRTRVETVHFASSAAQHLCCLRARITPENHTAPVIVRSGIDGTGYNLDRRPIYAEPPPNDPQMKWHKWARSRHLDEVAREHLPDRIYLETRTIDTGITIGYAALTRVSSAAESSVEQRYKYIEQVAHAQVAAGDTLTVDKLVAVYTSRDMPAASVRPACLDELRRHTAAGFDSCREQNHAAWQAKWADSDVT